MNMAGRSFSIGGLAEGPSGGLYTCLQGGSREDGWNQSTHAHVDRLGRQCTIPAVVHFNGHSKDTLTWRTLGRFWAPTSEVFRPDATNATRFAARTPVDGWTANTRVCHVKYGVGHVVAVNASLATNEGSNKVQRTVSVRFATAGVSGVYVFPDAEDRFYALPCAGARVGEEEDPQPDWSDSD